MTAQPTPAHRMLNSFLVDVFHSILAEEERMLQNRGFNDLSVSEMHMLCAIRQWGDQGAKRLAQSLGIRPATLSSALSVLEKKGCLARAVDERDRRRIRVILTPRGEQAVDAHDDLHHRMVGDVLDALTEEESRALARALSQIADYFRRDDP